ncbi:pimeloyl-ACP methyl ester carboxylesterase [Yoonia maricola]|uniref:Pimeloyl-ACP methyl ester carboxylesterase n=1 Tax=Yoonia maricola TaxID=420999 RepID=A0A2M8W633_9RHOB|nr:alpha/beta hydrolase [Yoonia maricola]PJI86386.1 pimeloyl-ACP methyl ester carboxylesterase [Yoonia maricola]
MPKIDVNGRSIHYVTAGSGPETIVFSHGYLMSHRMFAAQIEALSATYRLIAFDHRGHGGSGPCHQPFGIYDLVDDAEQVIDALCDGPVHFAGMSTGGYVGMRLLLRRPDLFQSLILMDTGANAESKASLRQYNQLLFLVRLVGIRPLLGKVLPLLFGQAFRNDPTQQDAFATWKADIGRLDRTSVRQFGRAIFDRDDVRGELQELDTPPPTLIIVGAKDIPTPPATAEELQEVIKGSELIEVADAGHTSPLERPVVVTEAITRFLNQQT